MKTRIHSIGLVAFAMLAASQMSFAQAYGAAYQNLMNTFMTNKIWELTMNKNQSSSTRSGSTPTTTDRVSTYGDVIKNTAVTPEQIKRAVQFKSTGTRVALDEFVGSLNATGQEKDDMKVRLIDLLNGFDSLAAAKGYSNDVAFALAFNVALNSAVYNETPVPSDVKIVEMRDLLAIGLTRYGLLEKATDRDKQGLYEYSVMTGQITYYCREMARKERDPAEELKRCKNVAAYNLRSLGINP